MSNPIPLALIGLAILAGCRSGPMPREVEAAGRSRAESWGDWIPLAEKERALHELLWQHFVTPEGLLAYRVPLPYADPPRALFADTKGWSSMWAVGEVLRARALGTAEAARRRDASLIGLDHLCRVSGTPGLVARTMIPFDPVEARDCHGPRRWVRGRGSHRGVDYSQMLWRTDDAKFQIAAWILALQIGLQDVEDPELRRDLQEDLAAVGTRVATAGYHLTEQDGTPTRFGDLHPAGRGIGSWFLSVCIAFPIDLWPCFDFAIGSNAMIAVALARVCDANVRASALWPPLDAQGFGNLIRDGIYRIPGITKFENDLGSVLTAWAILETDPPAALRDDVVAALRCIWSYHEHDRTPIHTFVAVRAGIIRGAEAKARVREMLYTLAVYPMARRNVGSDARRIPGLKRWLFKPNHATHALPINWLSSTAFIGKSDPTEIHDPGPRGMEAHSPADFVLSWWLYHELVRRGLVPAGLDPAASTR
jgi:hypothetical protein